MRMLPPVFSLLVFAACQSDNGQAPGNYEPRVSVYRADSGSTVWHNSFSGFRQRANLVVTDADTWSDVWATGQAAVEPKEPAPGIGFGEDGVIVAALGASPNTAFAIAIDSIEFFASSQKVYVTRSTIEGPACSFAAVVTNPVHMVRVPRPLNNVTFEEKTVVRSC